MIFTRHGTPSPHRTLTWSLAPEVAMIPSPHDTPESERPPLGQRIFDNVYLLLVLGLAVMLVIFTGWGMWEILSMPNGTLP